jgi:putative glutamine amidotransferase
MISIGISSRGQYTTSSWGTIISTLGFEGFAIQAIDKNTMSHKFDFIIFDGGADVLPFLYGQSTGDKTQTYPQRDMLEMTIFKKFLHTTTKFIGICRGSQFLNVMMNGTLDQHIHHGHPPSHRVEHTNLDTKLQQYVKQDTFVVNSTHHQAVKEVGIGLMPTLMHPTLKTIEGIESMPLFNDKIRAVQCHPESLNFDAAENLLKYLFRIL